MCLAFQTLPAQSKVVSALVTTCVLTLVVTPLSVIYQLEVVRGPSFVRLTSLRRVLAQLKPLLSPCLLD